MEERTGSVIKFFDKVSIAAIKLDLDCLAVGDTIRLKGNYADFTQKTETREFDHQPVQKSTRGQFTGIKLSQAAEPFDLVYRFTG